MIDEKVSDVLSELRMAVALKMNIPLEYLIGGEKEEELLKAVIKFATFNPPKDTEQVIEILDRKKKVTLRVRKDCGCMKTFHGCLLTQTTGSELLFEADYTEFDNTCRPFPKDTEMQAGKVADRILGELGAELSRMSRADLIEIILPKREDSK